MFYCHSNHSFTTMSKCMLVLLCSVVPALSPWLFPTFLYFLSCMAHCWSTAVTKHFITTACRENPGQMGRRAQGSRRNLLRWVIPSGANHSALFLLPHDVLTCWIVGYNMVCPYILWLMVKLLADKGTDQCYLNSFKPAGLSLLKFQPGGISLANSLVERFQNRILSEDISAEEKCWAETEAAGEGDCFLVSALTGLGLLQLLSGTPMSSLTACYGEKQLHRGVSFKWLGGSFVTDHPSVFHSELSVKNCLSFFYFCLST